MKRKNRPTALYFTLLFFISVFMLFSFGFAQDTELEIIIDANSNTIPLPQIFKPSIDLSGRGFHRDSTWPQNLASRGALETWEKEIGLSGIYRLQYSFWEITQFAKDKDGQKKLLDNYESVIKSISDSGGIVILDIFGTPAGMGRVLDKRSAPVNLKAFKELVKSYIRDLSCNKRYNVWYEVWSAPDLDDFFLGRKQDYLNLYRTVAQAALELREETKIYIPVGGPSVSWWFQNLDTNTVVKPERSLIYELIKFCSRYKLPLDFISWHAYSTAPKTEKEMTLYNKPEIVLIKEWLSYFNMNINTPLVVSEWNYDSGKNLLIERGEKSFVAASFLPARLNNMYESGLNHQLFFSLEDFRDKKEGVSRNIGAFWFDPSSSGYKGGPKVIYNVFLMLSRLQNNLLLPESKINDEFVGIIATKSEGGFVFLIYNYLDPEIAKSHISGNISALHPADRRALLDLIKYGKLDKILSKEIDIETLRLRSKLKTLLKESQELKDKVAQVSAASRAVQLSVKNIKGRFLYQRYAVGPNCSSNCVLKPVEEKEIIPADGLYQEKLSLDSYSVEMIILKSKPEESNPAQEQPNKETDKAK